MLDLIIIGAGPAGLSACLYASRAGLDVLIFDSAAPGGKLNVTAQIENYPGLKPTPGPEIAFTMYESALSFGAKMEYGEVLDIKDYGDYKEVITAKQTYQTKYVLIATGTKERQMNLEKENELVGRGISYCAVCDGPFFKNQEVAVIGGGNVSMDAVRTAKRLGAKKVSIVYRRRTADMTALPAEIEGAVAEGIEVLTLKAPSRIETNENGHVSGIYVTPQMISKIKDGRASVCPTGEEDFLIPCQTLIVAIGQDIESEHFAEAGVPVSRGKIMTERYGGFDNIPGVFAGGDCASGPASVIKAIAAAKVVAANIDEYLGFHHIISCDVEIPEPRLSDREPCGRVEITEREACSRVCDFEGVENCMTEAEAKQESYRCLRCDHFGYGIFKGGRKEKW
jgi:thioredoxin reductase